MHDHAPAALTAIAGLWPLIVAVFLTGLAGGFGHCAGMCGPFVLAQVAGGIANRRSAPGPSGPGVPMTVPVLARLRGGVLLPYHLGRLTTYAALGGVMAGLSGMIVMETGFRWLLAALLGLAALLFLGQAVKGFARFLPVLARLLPGAGGGGGGGQIGRLLSRPLRPLLADPRGINGYLLGLVLGFLPCGFLYAALASAVGTGSLAGGVAVMAAFALGTMPSLIVVGMLGSVAGASWTAALRAITPALMLVNAGMVGLMAWHALGA